MAALRTATVRQSPPHQQPTAKTIPPLPPAGGNGAASASGSIVGFSHLNHVAPSGGMVRVGNNEAEAGEQMKTGEQTGEQNALFCAAPLGSWNPYLSTVLSAETGNGMMVAPVRSRSR